MTLAHCHDASSLAADIAQRCEQATQHGDHWMACCPAHDDHNPSLSITARGDRVLLHCFATCSLEQILTALALTRSDLFVQASPNGHRRPEAIYPYVDEAGHLLYEVLRWPLPRAPWKTFSQRRPDPTQAGAYLEGKGCMQGVRLVLYNLPAVLAATQRGDTIYVVEGEKDAETLTRHGLTATTNAMGAGKWRQSYTDTLRGAQVVLLPDNDPQGREHMGQVAASLERVVASLTLVKLPLLPPKGDVTDWLQQGHTLEDFHQEVQTTPPEEREDTATRGRGDTETGTDPSLAASSRQAPVAASPVPLAGSMVSFAALLERSLAPRKAYMAWLREHTLTMVYGPAGVGKTMFLLGTALSLATPRPLLTWAAPEMPVGVLYVDGEMSLDELKDRARQLAGDDKPEHLYFLPSELVYEQSQRDLTLTTKADRLAIDRMLEAHGLQVLILDNVSCLFPGIDESKKQDWEPIAQWLIQLRHRGITVLVGHHAGKNGQQRGTSGREDALDTVLALSRPPGWRPEEGCHFHLRFEKSRGITGPAVAALDVRAEQLEGQTVLTGTVLEVTRTEQVKAMLADDIPPRVIAEELAIQLSYVYRMKKLLERQTRLDS